MAEGTMIAERFPMVRGDDHHGVVEEPPSSQVLEQPAELFIEEGDAIVVAVAGHLEVPFHRRRLVHPHVIEQEVVLSGGPGPDPEAALGSRRGYVRVVGVVVVQEGEEGTIRPTSAQPVEEGGVDPPAPRDWRPIHFMS